jgi:predicted nucleotidyltransferase
MERAMSDNKATQRVRIEKGMSLQEFFQKLSEKLSEEIKVFYSGRLVSLVVFGSVGRGTATAESDIDLLIIATDLPLGRIKRVSEFTLVENRLQHHLDELKKKGFYPCFSPVIKTPEEVLSGSPLFFDMIFDSLVLYDKERFFQTFLAHLKERLDQLGARRIVQGDRWYWDLKPDYHAGQVFEI